MKVISPQQDFSQLVKDSVLPVETVLYIDQTIEEAIRELRQRKIDEQIVYFYVVDKEHYLIGVVSSRNLLLRDPSTKIADIMEKAVVRIDGDQTLEKAMELMAHHHLLAIPVVDDEGFLIGCIDVRMYMDDSVDIVDARFRRDVFQMIGLTIEEGRKQSVFRNYGMRMPWIFCNMAGGIGCAIISRVYEPVLLKVILLAMFIPLVLSLGESISMQSMSQSMQILRDRMHISLARVLKQTIFDGQVVLLLAITSGIVVGALSLFWGEGLFPAIVIAISLLISITISALVGASLPLLLHIKKLDPKVACGPIVLALADIIGTAIYLTLGTWWLL